MKRKIYGIRADCYN